MDKKKVIALIALILVILVAVWFSSLKPEVKGLLMDGLLGRSTGGVIWDTVPQ